MMHSNRLVPLTDALGDHSSEGIAILTAEPWRALLARAGACDAAGWRDAADAVRAAAARLTHPIGAALLGDLLVGEGWAALHDLAAALARDDEPAALEAARRLTRLGHSSGWDLLAGFVAGARG